MTVVPAYGNLYNYKQFLDSSENTSQRIINEIEFLSLL